MKWMKVIYMGLGGVIALALAGAAFLFVRPTLASQVAPAAAAAIGLDDGVFHGRGPNGGRGGHGARLDIQSYLLDELGITQEEFDAARETARTAAIDQALADGLITEAQAEALKEGTGGRLHGFGFRGGPEVDHEALLADALGITVEELETAKENARAAAVAQALADGEITQEQVDRMEVHQALKDAIDREAILAEALGVTVADVAAARENRTMADLVEASGLTQAELRDALQAAHQAAVDQAVEDGVITREQADLLGDGGMFGPGGRRGFGGPRGNQGFPGRGFNGQGQGAPDTAPAAGSFSG